MRCSRAFSLLVVLGLPWFLGLRLPWGSPGRGRVWGFPLCDQVIEVVSLLFLPYNLTSCTWDSCYCYSKRKFFSFTMTELWYLKFILFVSQPLPHRIVKKLWKIGVEIIQSSLWLHTAWFYNHIYAFRIYITWELTNSQSRDVCLFTLSCGMKLWVTQSIVMLRTFCFAGRSQLCSRVPTEVQSRQ